MRKRSSTGKDRPERLSRTMRSRPAVAFVLAGIVAVVAITMIVLEPFAKDPAGGEPTPQASSQAAKGSAVRAVLVGADKRLDKPLNRLRADLDAVRAPGSALPSDTSVNLRAFARQLSRVARGVRRVQGGSEADRRAKKLVGKTLEHLQKETRNALVITSSAAEAQKTEAARVVRAELSAVKKSAAKANRYLGCTYAACGGLFGPGSGAGTKASSPPRKRPAAGGPTGGAAQPADPAPSAAAGSCAKCDEIKKNVEESARTYWENCIPQAADAGPVGGIAVWYGCRQVYDDILKQADDCTCPQDLFEFNEIIPADVLRDDYGYGYDDIIQLQGSVCGDPYTNPWALGGTFINHLGQGTSKVGYPTFGAPFLWVPVVSGPPPAGSGISNRAVTPRNGIAWYLEMQITPGGDGWEPSSMEARGTNTRTGSVSMTISKLPDGCTR